MRDENDPGDETPETSTEHFQNEWKELRGEVLGHVAETRKIETYAVALAGAVWAWLATHPDANIPWPAWWIPMLLAFSGGFRVFALNRQIKVTAEYLRLLERKLLKRDGITQQPTETTGPDAPVWKRCFSAIQELFQGSGNTNSQPPATLAEPNGWEKYFQENDGFVTTSAKMFWAVFVVITMVVPVVVLTQKALADLAPMVTGAIVAVSVIGAVICLVFVVITWKWKKKEVADLKETLDQQQTALGEIKADLKVLKEKADPSTKDTGDGAP